MKREEALEVMWKNLPSDKNLPVYEALQTLIPELRPKFRVEDIAEYPLGCDNNGNLVWSIAEESDAVPVRFEEEDGEEYPVADYKLMEQKPTERSEEVDDLKFKCKLLLMDINEIKAQVGRRMKMFEPFITASEHVKGRYDELLVLQDYLRVFPVNYRAEPPKED